MKFIVELTTLIFLVCSLWFHRADLVIGFMVGVFYINLKKNLED